MASNESIEADGAPPESVQAANATEGYHHFLLLTL